jgi:hypothetical protein
VYVCVHRGEWLSIQVSVFILGFIKNKIEIMTLNDIYDYKLNCMRLKNYENSNRMIGFKLRWI